jgi:hypothetical protein
MTPEEAIEELKDLLRAFGNIDTSLEYNYLRDEEPENYKTAIAIETVLNLIKKQEKIIDLMANEFVNKTLMYSDFKIEEVKQYFEDKVNSSEQN